MRNGAAALILFCALPASGRAWFWDSAATRALRSADASFLAGDLSGAAQVLAPQAAKDLRCARELLALRFLAQDFQGVEDLALSRLDALDPSRRLLAARAAACRADWTGCLRHLEALPLTPGAQALALRAEALQALGDTRAAEAMHLALSATAGTRLEAATALLAGEAAEAAGDAALAEARYKQAESADPSFTGVHARLARLYQAQGRVKDARIRLERARRVDSDDEGLRAALNSLLAAAPGQLKALRREEDAARARFLATANPTVAPHALRDGEPLLRVGLLDEAPRFNLVLGGPYLDEASGRTLTAQSAWLVRLAKGGGWELHCLSPSVRPVEPLRFSEVLRLRPLEPGSTFGLHAVDHGAGYFWASQEDRYYRGLAELRPQKARGVTLVNELGLESYLLSVVPSEIRPQWPLESLRAQAIAARTEAWRGVGRFKHKGYDLCPTVACAVYAGVGAEDSRSSAAVRDTAGEVLEDARGRLAPTYYMHNSGGRTQEPSDAWGGSEPKAGAKGTGTVDAPPGSALEEDFPLSPAKLLDFLDDADPSAPAWGREAATFRWTLRLSAAELEASVRKRHPGALPLRQVLPLQRSSAGYVQRVLFSGAAESIGSSDYIRSAIKGLKSNLFYAEPRLGPDGAPVAFLFHGGGWGHGVGLSQSGARAMAAAGKNASDILRHYFGAQTLKARY